MEGITIRKAELKDAAEIANVHTNSWREAYKGMFPEEFLNDRPLMFKNRMELWKQVTVNEKQVTLVAESKEHGIVGFINGSNGRDDGYKDYVEVWSFYLLQKYHGQKIGFNLLKGLFDKHTQLGFKKGYLWVLTDNPTISFYERAGGVHNGTVETEDVGGVPAPHLLYIWDSIEL